MKLMTYTTGGAQTYGIAVDGGVIDVGARLGGSYPSLRTVLEADALGEVEALAGETADAALDDVTFLPPIPEPEKIICVGLNYEDHRIETGREPTGYPVLFARYAHCQVGHGQAMVRPNNSEQFDYEGELVAVVGQPARHVGRADALNYLAGYSIYNDGSVRDWQGHTHQFLPGKNFDGTGGFGPWLVTADEIPDPATLTLTTRLNGAVMQHANTDQLIFNIPYLVSYLSDFMQLRPGDVIVTGTPGGVGFRRDPPVFMRQGDTIEVEISRIGTLTNPIVDE